MAGETTLRSPRSRRKRPRGGPGARRPVRVPLKPSPVSAGPSGHRLEACHGALATRSSSALFRCSHRSRPRRESCRPGGAGRRQRWGSGLRSVAPGGGNGIDCRGVPGRPRGRQGALRTGPRALGPPCSLADRDRSDRRSGEGVRGAVPLRNHEQGSHRWASRGWAARARNRPLAPAASSGHPLLAKKVACPGPTERRPPPERWIPAVASSQRRNSAEEARGNRTLTCG